MKKIAIFSLLGFGILLYGCGQTTVSSSLSSTPSTTTLPAVTTTSPTSMETGVLTTSTVSAVFSKDMDSSTITTTTFTLSRPLEPKITGTVTYSASSKTATFTPASSLGYNSTFTATISADAKDTDGSKMSGNYTWSFTTTIESSTAGTIKWSFTTDSSIESSPAIGSDGIIYIVSTKGTVYAINPDGTKKWEYTICAPSSSSPVIGSDGTVYVCCNVNKLHALESDGTIKWIFDAGAGYSIVSTPAIDNAGNLYFGSSDRKIYCVKNDGTKKWDYTTTTEGSGIQSSPAISSDESVIYVGSSDKKLYAINTSDGSKKWSYTTNGGLRSSPAIDSSGNIYIGGGDGYLYAIKSDGTLNWKSLQIAANGQSGASGTGGVRSSPALDPGGNIFVGSGSSTSIGTNIFNRVNFIMSSGSSGGSFDTATLSPGTENNFRSTPAIGADGTIYIGNYDGYLYAIKSADMSLIWRCQVGPIWFSSPAIGTDGTIYIGSLDGKIYAVNSSSTFGLVSNGHWPKFHHDNKNTGNKGP